MVVTVVAEVVVGVVVVGWGSSIGAVVETKEDCPATAMGTWTGTSTARSATRPTAWEATPTATVVASNHAARSPSRFFISS